MKNSIHKRFRRILLAVFLIVFGFFVFNGILIYRYSFEYSEQKSDVAIVLGAGTNRGRVSAVFKERLNHGIYLYKKKKVRMILLTGGYGAGQTQSDSEIASAYVLRRGVPKEAIIIEKKSRYTVENLRESVRMMRSWGLKSALLVSDPLHMKRSMAFAEKLNMNCKPSPTKTTMYRSFLPKAKSLVYETFYFSLNRIAGKN